MACHQHRCCRRPPSSADATTVDYVLLGADDAALIEGAATILSGAGAAAERHELGLRLNCRGCNWKAALTRLADALAAPARRALRVALVPLSPEPLAFHKALLMSQSLEAFIASHAHVRTKAATSDTHAFGDVFKGQSLE